MCDYVAPHNSSVFSLIIYTRIKASAPLAINA